MGFLVFSAHKWELWGFVKLKKSKNPRNRIREKLGSGCVGQLGLLLIFRFFFFVCCPHVSKCLTNRIGGGFTNSSFSQISFNLKRPNSSGLFSGVRCSTRKLEAPRGSSELKTREFRGSDRVYEARLETSSLYTRIGGLIPRGSILSRLRGSTREFVVQPEIWLSHPSALVVRLPVDEPALASTMTHDHAKKLCASKLGPLKI